MYNAIFYDGGYYLLPEAFSDYEAFRKDLCGRELPASYSMVALLEDHHARNHTVIKGRSMAPFFLSGYHDEATEVTITDGEAVYPVRVEVMSQEEYNAKLREVINRVCPGCLRFKPLSNRVQSLNGHFEEMTLDGVCVYRQETKPAPRVFRESLFYFGGSLRRGDRWFHDSEEMEEEIKTRLCARYAAASLEGDRKKKVLTVSCKKKELLTPLVTEAVSRYVDKLFEGTYHIRLAEELCCTEDYLKGLLSEANAENYRKECKKYGVSLAVLSYDEQAVEAVRNSLKPLVDHFMIFPLLQEAGKEYYLLSDTSEVLKELRYRSPLLETYHTEITVFDQYRNTRCRVGFAMERETDSVL